MAQTASKGGERRETKSASPSLRIPPTLWARFEPASRDQHRSRSAQACFLIETFVEEYEREQAAA